MFTKANLLKQAQTIKTLEERAEKRYADLISELNSVEVIDVLTSIKKDEQKHQKIMQDIVDKINQ